MTATLAELYQDPALHAQASCYMDIWRQTGVDTVLERVGDFAHLGGAALVAGLDTLRDDSQAGYDTRTRVASLLGSLPARTLLESFGEEVTAWTFANGDRYREERLTDELAEEGYDPLLLKASALQSYRWNEITKGRDVLANNAVMEQILGNGLSSLDLPALLRASALPGVSMREARAKKYGLIPVRLGDDPYLGGEVREWEGKADVEKRPTEPGEGEGLSYHLWLDRTYVGAVLTHNKVPQMIVGLQAEGTDEVMVVQMQRLRGKVYDPAKPMPNGNYEVVRHKQANGLVRLDWPRLAVGVAAHIATRLGMSNVGILEAKQVPIKNVDIPPEQAKEVYDDNADRLFFQKGKDGNWHKPVSELTN